MKKTAIIFSALLFVFSIDANAQKKGFLNKLKDAATEVGNKVTNPNSTNQTTQTNSNPMEMKKEESSSKKNKNRIDEFDDIDMSKLNADQKKMINMLKEDYRSKELEKLPVTKDSKNISGIYYVSDPIIIGDGADAKFGAKFLINYNEKPNNANELEIISKYSLDKSNGINKLVYIPAKKNPSNFVVPTSLKFGHLMLDGITVFDHKFLYKYYGRTATTYRFNKNNPQFQSMGIFIGENIVELEPGILVTCALEDIYENRTPEKRQDLLEQQTFVLFHKEDKKERADYLKKNPKEVWEKLIVFYDKYRPEFKKVEKGSVSLAKPIATFKDQPSNSDLMKAAKTRMTNIGWKEQLVYVYPATSWENKFENVGIMGKTLTHRMMQIQAVLKDGDQCKVTQFLIRQNNAYTAGSATEKFSGNPIEAIGDIDKFDMSCTEAMKNKK